MLADMDEIEARGGMIRLGQLLQVAGLAESGGGRRRCSPPGVVKVDDEPETRRGRQLHPGDVVAAARIRSA